MSNASPQAQVPVRVLLTHAVEGLGPVGAQVEVGKAQSLALVASGRAKLAPVRVRFLTGSGGYNGGEVASFPPKEAEALIKRRVAALEADEVSAPGLGYTPALLDLTTVKDWRAATRMVAETDDIAALERWLETDQRSSVQTAILKRCQELAALAAQA